MKAMLILLVVPPALRLVTIRLGIGVEGEPWAWSVGKELVSEKVRRPGPALALLLALERMRVPLVSAMTLLVESKLALIIAARTVPPLTLSRAEQRVAPAPPRVCPISRLVFTTSVAVPLTLT